MHVRKVSGRHVGIVHPVLDARMGIVYPIQSEVSD